MKRRVAINLQLTNQKTLVNQAQYENEPEKPSIYTI